MDATDAGALSAIGDTPLVELRAVVSPGSARVVAKLEFANPTGSMKDRMARAAVQAAIADGRLAPGDTVVEYTAGTTGISLAFVCAALGHPLHIVFSDAFSVENFGSPRRWIRSNRSPQQTRSRWPADSPVRRDCSPARRQVPTSSQPCGWPSTSVQPPRSPPSSATRDCVTSRPTYTEDRERPGRAPVIAVIVGGWLARRTCTTTMRNCWICPGASGSSDPSQAVPRPPVRRFEPVLWSPRRRGLPRSERRRFPRRHRRR